MVPILNHSVFINIKSVITNVIIEIVREIELDITISLYPGLKVETGKSLVESLKLGFNLYSGK